MLSVLSKVQSILDQSRTNDPILFTILPHFKHKENLGWLAFLLMCGAWDYKSQAETESVLKHTGPRPTPTCFSMFSVSDAELHSAATGQQGYINKNAAHPKIWVYEQLASDF